MRFGEEFDGNSISILLLRSISETTEDEGSGRVPTKFDPVETRMDR